MHLKTFVNRRRLAQIGVVATVAAGTLIATATPSWAAAAVLTLSQTAGPNSGGNTLIATTPAGTVAWTTHVGPYTSLGAAHDAVAQWCRANGHRLAGPNWEIYGHWQNEWNNNPSRIRTDVFYLLASDPAGRP